MNWRATIENIATLICTTTIVLGLYAMGAGYFSLIGLVPLVNINYPIRPKGASQ